jgi:hypothetical protein
MNTSKSCPHSSQTRSYEAIYSNTPIPLNSFAIHANDMAAGVLTASPTNTKGRDQPSWMAPTSAGYSCTAGSSTSR